ncbi:hypothetical protein GOODEAATRI_031161 [Goodea atripinnis]|uniref:Uncharacterized protein n=1 Tax=Goodea atripinnis TaxID=208336 RepID=A0ABV0NPW9_9TELE
MTLTSEEAQRLMGWTITRWKHGSDSSVLQMFVGKVAAKICDGRRLYHGMGLDHFLFCDAEKSSRDFRAASAAFRTTSSPGTSSFFLHDIPKEMRTRRVQLLD